MVESATTPSRHTLRFQWTILILLTVILGGSWILFSKEPVVNTTDLTGLVSAAQAGYLAPDFTLSSYLGEEISLRDYQEQPIVLNFWASWCAPCRLEMPHLQTVSEQFNGRVAILGTNQGESVAEISAFATELGLTFPLLVDTNGLVNREYDVRALPTTIFIDRDGVVREVFTGTLNQAVLEDRINRLLDEGS